MGLLLAYYYHRLKKITERMDFLNRARIYAEVSVVRASRNRELIDWNEARYCVSICELLDREINNLEACLDSIEQLRAT